MSKTRTGEYHEYVRRRKRLSGLFFETALPNEYLVRIGEKTVRPQLGGRRLRLFRKFIRIPASIQTLEFSTDNANVDFQGLGIEGFAAWQISPDNPGTAIRALDLFDEEDPMARTAHDLQLICIEAVRHVVANMTIEDAHRKKDDIAQDLKRQLKEIEDARGIVFHQVGIRHVKIMSESVFNDLQSRYRNSTRLESERNRIETDRALATQENEQREQAAREQIESDRKLDEQKVANRSRVRSAELQSEQELAEREHDLNTRRLELEITLKQEREAALLEVQKKLADLQNQIEIGRLEVGRLRRALEQQFSADARAMRMIEILPEIAQALEIQNYTVLDGSGDGISPVGRLIQEVLTILGSQTSSGAEERQGDAAG